jgi:predicted transcriptional regulator
VLIAGTAKTRMKEDECLRRSKFETYLDILGVLERNGELKLTHIMYETNVNCCILKQYLDFLVKQNLVEERTVGRQRTVYSITQRGVTVLGYYRELKQVLPIMDEDYEPMPEPT